MPMPPQTYEDQAARTPLSRERVLWAAVALADEHGIDAVSERKLGQDLGVDPMSLYNHVANEGDLLDETTHQTPRRYGTLRNTRTHPLLQVDTDRLVEEGLVAPEREEVEHGRLRRYYRITAEGRRLLAAEADRLATDARLASARLGLRSRPA